MSEGVIRLKQGREKPVNNQHPWLFSGAIASAEGASPGDIVRVVDSGGNYLARGYWNAHSQIQVRLLTWQDEVIDAEWWQTQLSRAYAAREPLRQSRTTAYRLIHAENDFLPGLIVDKYGDWLVLQALTLHVDQHKHDFAQWLVEITGAPGVYERSDVDVRGKEGLSDSVGLLIGEEPPEIIDTGNQLVDVRRGHKTGTYLDQTDNQRIVAELAAQHPAGRWLNTFCYTGSFSTAIMRSHPQATTINVDTSDDALALAEQNFSHFGIDSSQFQTVQADVFDYLRTQAADNTRQFDGVILDPPKFASSKSQVDRAARGYKDINLHGFQLVKPGGYMVTFSCSGAISRDLFQKIVFGALADSGRQAQIIRQLAAPPDHPIALTFPEGEYLKGFVLRVY